MPKCHKRHCRPQKVTLPPHENRLRLDCRPTPKTPSKNGGDNPPAIAPAVFPFRHHLDLDGGGNSFWSDSLFPPYFMAGVGAGAPEPRDSWCVTPLSASDCPACFACPRASSEIPSG